MSEHCLLCGHKIATDDDKHTCPSCGAIRATDDTKRIHARCPRCRDVRLTQFALRSVALQACGRCQGSFLPATEWDALLDTFASEPLPPFTISNPVEETRSVEGPAYRTAATLPSTEAPSLDPMIACPTCDAPMERFEFAGVSGIVVDVCADHGIWLDGGELARVVERAYDRPTPVFQTTDSPPPTRRAPVVAPSRIDTIARRLLKLRGR